MFYHWTTSALNIYYIFLYGVTDWYEQDGGGASATVVLMAIKHAHSIPKHRRHVFYIIILFGPIAWYMLTWHDLLRRFSIFISMCSYRVALTLSWYWIMKALLGFAQCLLELWSHVNESFVGQNVKRCNLFKSSPSWESVWLFLFICT